MRAAYVVVAVIVDPGMGNAEVELGVHGFSDECTLTFEETGTVENILDGDSLRLTDGRIVRLAGIEAPKPFLVRPGADIEAVADTAHRTLEQLASGEPVAIHPGDPARDRHGRFLAHVALADGTWLQAAMIGRGLARVRPFAGEDACLEGLRVEERKARRHRRGLWRIREFYPVSAYDPSLIERNGVYVLVEGRVISVGHGNRVDFLNFGHVWRRDFTVLVGAPTAERLAELGRSTDSMVGKRVRVRGVIEENGGPAIRLNNPGEIEILSE